MLNFSNINLATQTADKMKRIVKINSIYITSLLVQSIGVLLIYLSGISKDSENHVFKKNSNFLLH
ncbi:hypothetical protein AKJ57_02180 [candidate division MSBL1 archaeon SCGC-AAA259A05]|uniref:Uncharacterized protein n=1 Tax=candidate division MSBL1 archaeon SCGC-AAA259A05 TaxID=1698259 RepID=A0A133UAG1_9EURY|nr:hypothetical protein AKJ57_02180 [candidate division MSBL1 archaeon SCGC-AAA259A05]